MLQLSSTYKYPSWVLKERELHGDCGCHFAAPLASSRGSVGRHSCVLGTEAAVGNSLLATAELTAEANKNMYKNTVQGKEPLRNQAY